MKLRIKRKRTVQLPEITLTPLIDTALTLLIIFMVTTPMIQHSIKVRLPEGSTKEGGTSQQYVVVTLTADEQVYVNNNKVTFDALTKVLQSSIDDLTKRKVPFDKRVWIRADQKSYTGLLVNVMKTISEGGFNVVVATDQPTRA